MQYFSFSKTNFSYFVQQSHEVLKSLFSKSVENVTDISVPSPVKDDEKYLIRILLESFSSNKLGTPNCKVIFKSCFKIQFKT